MKENPITGGASGPGYVSFRSEKWVSTAWYDDADGSISVEVEPHSAFVNFLYRLRQYPIPRLAFLFLNAMSALGKRGVLIIGCLSATMFFFGETSYASSMSKIGFVLLLGIGLWHVRFRAAPWHAAEHMAFNALERGHGVAVSEIANESRLQKECGGRFAVPILSASIFSYGISNLTGINQTIALFAMVEAVLWLDHFGWLEKVPFILSLSFFLQKWVTTSAPSKKHLQTAHDALAGLLAKYS